MIPGFRHRALIDAGGSSEVHLYEWQQEKVDVAVKVWRDRLGPETQDTLARETTEVAELAGHPHVLPLHVAGVTDDGRSFVVMDHRTGGDLSPEYEGERLSVAEALRITIKVAGALDVAARHGILHGDVKPANILLTSGGEPQVVGFGSLSSAGRPGGTASTSLPWMAPEMLADPPEPSAWADIWSLAATCYTLLAGRTPFEGRTGSEPSASLAERIREGELPPLGRDDVPASFEEALRKAMFKRRAGRHWSAADFARSLQAVEEELGLPVTSLANMPQPGDEPVTVPRVLEVASSPAPPLVEAADTAEVPIVVGPVPDSVAEPAAEPVIKPVAEPVIEPIPVPPAAAEPVDDDLLGHHVDVDRVARLVTSAHTQLPISVAVQGLPGSGRSTFLRKVQERVGWLAEHDSDYAARTRHVRIDARQYAEGDVASGVLESVRRAGRSEPPPLVAKHRAAQRRAAELGAALAGVPDEDGHRGKRRTQQPMTTTMALAAMDREVAAYEAALRAAPPGPPPGPPGQPGSPSGVRTIVYVDNLDRCDGATTAGVLRAVDELSCQEGVAVVAAVDARTLRRSLEGRMAEPAAYLSRVFDVPFALRAFAGDPAVRFMRSLMRQAVPSWPSALATGSAADRSGRPGAVASFEMSPGEALFMSELARFCATPGAARKLLAVYRLARTAPVATGTADPAAHQALGILMAILVGAPAQAVQVLGAVVEALAGGEDTGTFRALVEKVARRHTVECGRATCGTCADWSRVIRAYADLVRGQQVPQEVGAYAGWVDEVARFSFPT